MKRFLAVVFFASASLQANDLAKGWRNFGKQYRLASAAKALIIGALVIESGKASFHHGRIALNIAGNNEKWLDKWQIFTRELVTSGSTLGTAVTLGYYFFPDHIKHAFAVK